MSKTFKIKPYISKKVGSFVFDFYYKQGKLHRCFLRINEEDSLFSLRIAGNTDAYGFLLTAALQGKTEQLHGYISTIYIATMAMTQDQTLTDDCTQAVSEWMRRRREAGERRAAEVTDEQEAAAQSFMEDVAAYADAKTDKERKEIRETWREEMKNEIAKSNEETDDNIQGD